MTDTTSWVARVATDADKIIQTTSYDVLRSTQYVAREKAERLIAGAELLDPNEWLLIRADRQTHGFGQHNRTWFSPPGNLYLTYLLPWPKSYLHALVHLSQATTVAVAQVLERFALQPRIKWVNDVFVHGKKICGVLCERPGTLFQMPFVLLVVGIGLNVGMQEGCMPDLDQAITSMDVETGRTHDKEAVVEQLNQNLIAQYQLLIQAGFPALRPYIQEHLLYVGEWVQVETQYQTVCGLFEGLNPLGEVVLKTQEGTHVTLNTGRMSRAS